MTAPSTFVLRSRRVYATQPDGDVREIPACIVVRNEIIAGVLPWEDLPSGMPCTDVGDLPIMPGVVDTHVHINEPGRTEWEGFATATRAAAAGGITAVIDMPLNSVPPTTTAHNLRLKAEAAQGQCAVDYGFWGGVVPDNVAALPALLDKGVFGCKAFLIESGMVEFPQVDEHALRAAMQVLKRYDVPLLAHAEMCIVDKDPDVLPEDRNPRSYMNYLRSRPARWEVEAIRLLIALCRETGCAVHIVHLSAADALPILDAARAEGLPISAETCPHYLTIVAEDIPDGATEYKCAPPIRERENCERLWNALQQGRVDFVVSDHSPCLPALKCPQSGDFSAAWGGITSLQYQRALIWTALQARGMTLTDLVRLQSTRPARFLRLGSKGRISMGCDADLVVFDPDAAVTIAPDTTWHRHKHTPYAGRTVLGKVRTTYLRGRIIHDEGEFPHGNHGQPIWRAARPH